jgi:mannose-6-phosphate isomerase-like protein (cupin superfamily)
MGTVVKTPWGHWKVLRKGEGFKIKELHVYTAKRTSLQYHRFRDEIILVTLGSGTVEIGGKRRGVKTGDYFIVKHKQRHRIGNPKSTADLEMVEIQVGSALFEKDVVRLKDDYGRAVKR